MKFFHFKPKGIGLPPGSMIYSGDQKVESVTINAMVYDQDGVDKYTIDPGIEFTRPVHEGKITWLNVVGLHDVSVLENMRHAYNIHPLVMEDILNTDQRPKIQFFDDYIFISMKFISFHKGSDNMIFEQISLVVGLDYLIVFQEFPDDPFDPVRERIANGKGKIRKHATDYLTYALIDVMVDHYYHILETLGRRLELIDEDILENPSQAKMNMIQQTKREQNLLRRSIWPLRDLTGNMSREEHNLIKESTGPFINDLYDHVVQVIDTLESYRDITASLLDLYLSSLSQKMNEVMKVLTIIATIFIPATFIAGIYGMNFEFMPELAWKYSYPVLWGVFLVLFSGMLVFFRRKKWL